MSISVPFVYLHLSHGSWMNANCIRRSILVSGPNRSLVHPPPPHNFHYNDIIMSTMASEITSLNCLFRHRSKKRSKLRVTGLCAGNSPVTGEFPAQMASNAENVSIWWRHHVIKLYFLESLHRLEYRIDRLNWKLSHSSGVLVEIVR